jgi:hypothetical protein
MPNGPAPEKIPEPVGDPLPKVPEPVPVPIKDPQAKKERISASEAKH